MKNAVLFIIHSDAAVVWAIAKQKPLGGKHKKIGFRVDANNDYTGEI